MLAERKLRPCMALRKETKTMQTVKELFEQANIVTAVRFAPESLFWLEDNPPSRRVVHELQAAFPAYRVERTEWSYTLHAPAGHDAQQDVQAMQEAAARINAGFERYFGDLTANEGFPLSTHDFVWLCEEY